MTVHPRHKRRRRHRRRHQHQHRDTHRPLCPPHRHHHRPGRLGRRQHHQLRHDFPSCRNLRAGIVVHGGATLLGDITNSGTISGAPLGRTSYPGGIAVTSAAQFGTGSTGGNIINSGTISLGVNATLASSSKTFRASAASAIPAPSRRGPAAWGITCQSAPTWHQQFRHDHQPRHRHFAVVVSNFAGGVTNSGKISGGTGHGIFISVSSAFTGGIKNSGVISGRRRHYCNRRFLLRRLHQLRHDHDGRGRHWLNLDSRSLHRRLQQFRYDLGVYWRSDCRRQHRRRRQLRR